MFLPEKSLRSTDNVILSQHTTHHREVNEPYARHTPRTAQGQNARRTSRYRRTIKLWNKKKGKNSSALNTERPRIRRGKRYGSATRERGQKTKKKKAPFVDAFCRSCGSRTRTSDLWVMSPTSYQLLHPAMFFRGAKIVHLYTFCNTTIVKYCYFMQNPIIPQDNLHRYSCYSK